MAKLIAPDRKFGIRNRRIITDANGAPCCCGPGESNCCTGINPSEQCQYVTVTTGSQSAPCNTYRMRRYGTVDVTYELLMRHSNDTLSGGSIEKRVISVGLLCRQSFCYDQSRFGYFYGPSNIDSQIEGAYYDQLDFRYTTGGGFQDEYVAIGQGVGYTIRDLPLVAQCCDPIPYTPNLWFGPLDFNRQDNSTLLTKVPAHFGCTNVLSHRSSEAYIGGRTQEQESRSSFCALQEQYTRTVFGGTSQTFLSHSYGDDGVTGSFQYDFTFEQNARQGTTYRSIASTFIQFRSAWTRRPCPCITGPSELTGDIGEQGGRPIVATDFL